MKLRHLGNAVLATIFSINMASASELRDKVDVLEVAERYIKSVACFPSVGFAQGSSDASDIDKLKSIKAGNNYVYYVVWGGDLRCNGGNASFMHHITKIERTTPDWPFIVMEQSILLTDLSGGYINPRFLESFDVIDADTIVVVSSDFDQEDMNNFPSQKYEYVVQRRPDTGWTITDKTHLGSNDYSSY